MRLNENALDVEDNAIKFLWKAGGRWRITLVDLAFPEYTTICNGNGATASCWKTTKDYMIYKVASSPSYQIGVGMTKDK